MTTLEILQASQSRERPKLKPSTKNILNYKSQNLREPVMNGTKTLDSKVGPCLFVFPCLLKELECEYYNIFWGYYQCGQNPQNWQGRNEECNTGIRTWFCCLSIAGFRRGWSDTSLVDYSILDWILPSPGFWCLTKAPWLIKRQLCSLQYFSFTVAVTNAFPP